MQVNNTTRPAPRTHDIAITLSDTEADVIKHARRALRKATLRRDLSHADADVVNAVIMCIGRVLDDRSSTRWPA